MKIAVIDDERPARKELVHQIMDAMPDSRIEEADSGASAIELISRQAFELGVNNYILKPFDPDRVRRVLEKCHKDLLKSQALTASSGGNGDERQPWGEPCMPSSCASPQETGESVAASFPSSRMAINMNRTIILVDIPQIVYIETSGRSCIIHTTTRDYTENLLLGEYEKRLASHGFCRIHKSYLVNLSFITELFPWANNSLAVKMQGFEKNILPVSREKSKMLRQIIGV